MTIALLCAGCAFPRLDVGAQPLDDPTRPSGVRSTVQLRSPMPRELQLQGIFRRDTRRSAIVDGRIVHEGERIANATIVEISADAVRYSRGGHEHTVRLARTTVQMRQPSTPQVKLP